jgi:hypothetical protein
MISLARSPSSSATSAAMAPWSPARASWSDLRYQVAAVAFREQDAGDQVEHELGAPGR